MPSLKEDQSFKGLFSTLTEETYVLFRQEVQLAKAELRENLSQAVTGLVAVAAGGLIAFAALLVLLQALVVVLANFMAPSLAALVVGSITAVIAFALVQKGASSLKAKNLMPRKTVRTLQESTEMLKERVS